jgi:hypothetical protein
MPEELDLDKANADYPLQRKFETSFAWKHKVAELNWKHKAARTANLWFKSHTKTHLSTFS